MAIASAIPGQPFVDDLRGSSAFFAAWRPYVFSQVGKAGVKAALPMGLRCRCCSSAKWMATPAQTQLSYWVDYWLGQMFPAGSGATLLNFSNTNNAEVEVLPVINPDGSVVVLVSNHAVASASDNNGKGLDGSVTVDVSGLGPFTTASLVTIDSTTSPITGPTPVSISPISPITLTLNGYSVGAAQAEVRLRLLFLAEQAADGGHQALGALSAGYLSAELAEPSRRPSLSRQERISGRKPCRG